MKTYTAVLPLCYLYKLEKTTTKSAQNIFKKKQLLKYYLNPLPDDQKYTCNYDTCPAVKLPGWCSNCGENTADLCVTASDNLADLCVTASDNLAGARKSNCRDTYTLMTGAHTQTNSTNVFHSVIA